MEKNNLPPEHPWQSNRQTDEILKNMSESESEKNDNQSFGSDKKIEYSNGFVLVNNPTDSGEHNNTEPQGSVTYDAANEYKSTNTAHNYANITEDYNFDYGTYNDYGPRSSKSMHSNNNNGISKKVFVISLIIAMLLTSALTVGGMVLYDNHFSNGSDQATNYKLSKDTKQLSSDSIVRKTNPSVVSIVTEAVSTDSWAQNYVTKGAGSGVIIQKNGYIITCNHVIAGANKIKVTLSNNKSYEAKLIGASPDDDLAVIKINASGLKAATYGDSSALEVGDNVVAIGNPLGQLSNTASTGIISALNRKLTIDNKKLNLLQTDASINPGNSGGALFNSAGNLIGVVVAKSAGSDVEGLGFAIPINHAAKIAKTLIKSGSIKSKTGSSQTKGALIGVSIQEISKNEALRNGYDKGGVFIASVSSPYAQKAGLKSGDRISSFDGTEITGINMLRSALSKHKPGDKVKIEVVRNKHRIKTVVTLISRQEN